MFSLSSIKPTKILSQEQKCQICDKWFSLTDKELKELEKYWKQKDTIGFGVVCSKCGTVNGRLIPGRYDQPGTPKAKCIRQYTVLAADKPTVKVPTKKFVLKAYTFIHKGKRITRQVKYNTDGTLPWQPVKIGTRWYALRAAGIAKQSHRSEAACKRSVELSVALYSSLMQ